MKLVDKFFIYFLSIPTKNIIYLHFFPDVEFLIIFIVQNLYNVAKFMA